MWDQTQGKSQSEKGEGISGKSVFQGGKQRWRIGNQVRGDRTARKTWGSRKRKVGKKKQGNQSSSNITPSFQGQGT